MFAVRLLFLRTVMVLVAIGTLATKDCRAELIGEWKLDGNATDTSGNGFHGVILGGVTSTLNRFGAADSALQFNGLDGRITVADAPLLQAPAHSISTWFRWDQVGTDEIDFLTGKSIENFEIHTGGGSGTNGIRYIPADNHYDDSPGAIGSGWNHVAVSYDSSSGVASTYINSVLTLTTTAPGAFDLTGDFHIGARAAVGPRYFFNGAIDDVRLYNHVLSQAEVNSLFNETASVPEPSALGCLVFSLASLCLFRRRVV